MNAMLYVCGTDADYNQWSSMTGDASWNYTNILQYIKKHQNMLDTSLTTGQCANFHGTSGPLNISNVGMNADLLVPLLQSAANEMNYSQLPDINCGPPYNG